MVKALEALMQQRSRFDYVLIETTGLANPGPVAAALWTDEQLESRCAGQREGYGHSMAPAACTG
jgi:G3E family GTPase